MRAMMLLSGCLILACLAGCSPAETKSDAIDSPFAENPEIPWPEILAPQIISSADPEFATTFSPDGKQIFFNRTNADRFDIFIMTAIYRNGKWSAPQKLPFADGTWRDVDPFYHPGSQRLYFSSDRPLPGDTAHKDFDTWYVEKNGDGWSEPQNIGRPVNTSEQEIFVSLSKNGTLYYRGQRSGSRGLFSVSQNDDGSFGQPRRLKFGLPDTVRLGNPCISPNEDFLLFTAPNIPGGYGKSDIYISFYENGHWSKPLNPGPPLNSAFSDFAPGLSPDGRYLFFTSERPGIVPADAVEGRPPGDIYQIDMAVVKLLATAKSEIKTINGGKIFCKTVGNPESDESIIIVHGGPMLDHGYLLPHFLPLAKDYRLILFDQRLNGRSAPTADTSKVRIKAFVEDIEAIRKAYDAGQVHLMGHSWGGLLAMHYAIKFPGNLKSLMLLNSVSASSEAWQAEEKLIAERFTSEDSSARMEIMNSDAFRKYQPQAVEAMLRLSFSMQFDDKSMAERLNIYVPPDYQKRSAAFAYIARDLGAFDLYEPLAALEIPTLILYGEYEPAATLSGKILDEKISRSTLAIIPKTGHFPFIERPVSFLRTVREFISKI